LIGGALRIADAMEGERGSALEAVGQAERALGALERTDPTVAAWHELLDAAYANLTELARMAREYAGGFDNDPRRLQALEERRDVLYRLKQKYGDTLHAVLEARRAGAEELDLLDTAELDLRSLAARVAAAAETVRRAAEALSARRT